ncbi:hypothetical protein ACRZZB_001303, partial [Klebsiella oxytoca]
MEYDVLRIPGSRLTPYPGYGFTAVCDPVARTRRVNRRLREDPRVAADAIPGLRVYSRLRAGSPDKP